MATALNLEQPYFSVIVNCHNSDSYLTEALNSVINQSFQDFEIIVYDNASTDDTALISSAYGDKIYYYYSDIKCTLGAARNKAVENAKGKYLASLDSDDIWVSSKLEVQYAALKSNNSKRQVGLCGSDAMRMSANCTPIAKYSLGRAHRKGNAMISLMHDCFVPMSSTVVDREVCITLGGFDETYNIIEEYDLWIRIARRFEVIYLDECLVSIRFHSSNTSKNYFLMQEEVRRMFSSIDSWSEIESAIVNSAKLTWELRYKIVHLFNLPNERVWEKVKLIFQLGYFSLRNPRVFMLLVKPYFSKTLLSFAIIKYANKVE